MRVHLHLGAAQFTPESLRQHAAVWANSNHPELADSKRANGMCEDISHEYAEHLGKDRATPVAHDWSIDGEWENGHVYTRVATTEGDYAVDFTAHQSGEDLPHPWIQPLDKHVDAIRQRNHPGMQHEVYDNARTLLPEFFRVLPGQGAA